MLKKYIQQPKALWVLLFANFSDGFSSYGSMTILVLYAMHVFSFTRNQSYLLFGVYTALLYLTPFFGGIIADKLLGNRKTLIFSGLLAIVGNLIIVSQNRYGFSLGLAASVIGAGFYKCNSSHLIGRLYSDSDPKKETGFTLLYVFGNFGAAFAPVVFGALVYKAGWSYGFLFSACILLISVLWVIFSKAGDNEEAPLFSTCPLKVLGIYLLIISGCFLLSLPFYLPNIINPVMTVFFIIVIAYLAYIFQQYRGTEKQRLAALFALGFFGIFYYATTMQVETTVTLFIQQQIETGHISTKYPASVFSTLYCVFVVALAPLFSWIWNSLKKRGITLSASSRFALGIVIAGLGIFGFGLSSITSLILFGIVLGFVLLSAGDLIISPSIYTALSNNGPVGFKTSAMGFWFLVIALGSYLSSLLSMASHAFADKFFLQTHAYTGAFVFIGGFTILVSMALLVIAPRLNKILI